MKPNRIRADDRRRQALRLYAEADRIHDERTAKPADQRTEYDYSHGVEVGMRAAARMLDPTAEPAHPEDVTQKTT